MRQVWPLANNSDGRPLNLAIHSMYFFVSIPFICQGKRLLSAWWIPSGQKSPRTDMTPSPLGSRPGPMPSTTAVSECGCHPYMYMYVNRVHEFVLVHSVIASYMPCTCTCTCVYILLVFMFIHNIVQGEVVTTLFILNAFCEVCALAL